MVDKITKIIKLIILLIVLGFGVLLFFRVKYNDAIRLLAETQVRNTTSDLINDAIDKQIEEGNIPRWKNNRIENQHE